MNAYSDFEREAERDAPCPLHRAEELTLGGRTAKIMLGDSLYTLRITRQGKLILTK
ncbi:hemin uptake protein HemP [Maritimibacter sp. DP1N21-5]|uniref:hemin uptake protein HemP n=1 Tax=Maritimibacter sp. DP1N21-5 TaxID=2836867 RepID=UPI001C45327A|nr:hemin uptake protein HemP [Maritimibacter sp. DP1N21-5]MBV7409106.1 hemin uptake protein HemP [Maritimibacter sp. DP1N21-5]